MNYSKDASESREELRDRRTVKARVHKAKGESYLSLRDGCRVSLVRCERCLKLFEEETAKAVDKIEKGESFECLACDDEAVVPSFRGITIQLGWW